MNLHLVMTTINVPRVLERYLTLSRVRASPVTYHVVMDGKTPHEELRYFVREIQRAADDDADPIHLYSPIELRKDERWAPFNKGLLAFNHDGLRVAAFLEAYKAFADVVITVDDDNEPADPDFFSIYERLFAADSVAGVGAAPGDWVRSLPAAIWPRGYPYAKRAYIMRTPQPTSGKIVFHQGLTYGDPDVDALTRANGLARLDAPPVMQPLFGRQPVNTQNSALARKYVPFWWAPRFCERHWDIVASYLVQGLFELDERASAGHPFTYSKRNEHDNRADIRNEDVGAHLCEALGAGAANIRPMAGETLLTRYRRIGRQLQESSDRYVWHLGEAVGAWADALQKAGIAA